MDQVAAVLLALLAAIAALVFGALAWVEAQFGAIMIAAGIPPGVQTVIGVLVAIFFLLAALRLFGGVIRVILVILLVAIVVHAVTHGGRGPTIPASGRSTTL